MGRETGLDMTMQAGETLSFVVGVDADRLLNGTVTEVYFTARRKVSHDLLFGLELGAGITAQDEQWVFKVPEEGTFGKSGSFDYVVQFTIVRDGVSSVYMPLWGTLNVVDYTTAES